MQGKDCGTRHAVHIFGPFSLYVTLMSIPNTTSLYREVYWVHYVRHITVMVFLQLRVHMYLHTRMHVYI